MHKSFAVAFAVLADRFEPGCAFDISTHARSAEENQRFFDIYAHDAGNARITNADTNPANVRTVYAMHADGAQEWAGDIATLVVNEESFFIAGYAA